MRAVLQRVTSASVKVENEMVGAIESGLLVLLGVKDDDTERDAEHLVEKIAGLRAFNNNEGQMNRSIVDVGGALLVVSQFTLYGDMRRGRRPSWSEAAAPERAEPLYDAFVRMAREKIEKVETGSLRRMMQVELVNDGPVTILIDSRKVF